MALQGVPTSARAQSEPVSGRRRGHSAVAILLVSALVAAACSRSSGTAVQTKSSTSVLGTTEAAQGIFGTLKSPVCGPAPAGETNKATEQGITADSIRVGTISDPGYVGAPGLNQELFDASDVFTAWCNAQGGINGRKIQDDHLDAAIVNYKQMITEACGQDFSLVGGGGVFDDAGQDARLSCLLPDYAGYLVTPKARGADLTVQATPGPINSQNFGVARYLSEKYPDANAHIGYLTGNYGTTITNKNQYEEAGKAFGFKTVYDGLYTPTGEPTWAPFASAIQSKGVKGLYFVGEPEDLARLIAALAQINYKLDWISSGGNAYDPKVIKEAGAALDTEPLYIGDGTTPFEEADRVPAVQQYEDLFAKYLPNGKNKASLGLNSFSSWLLFAMAAKQCGADLTRKCLYDNGIKVASWDGGGLTAPSNPSQPNQAGQCVVVVKASSSSWSVINWQANHGVYNCSPKNVVALKGNYGKGEKLSDVGKSLSDLN
jgi:hypothetical protein